MLTPVDLQQKKFQHGMGYTKKDVDSFFDIVILSYTELYKSNAELTNQVKTLTDSLVHYRTTESKLQKSLDRKSTRLNSSHRLESRMPSSA